MNFDFDCALRDLHNIGKDSFEKAIFAVSAPLPFESELEELEPRLELGPLELTNQPEVVEDKEIFEETQLEELLDATSTVASHDNKVKVLFITDSFDHEQSFAVNDYTAATDIESQLEGFLKIEVISLFGKMVQAMGLSGDDFAVGAVKNLTVAGENTDCIDQLNSKIIELRPKMIITIGATATNTLLQFKERLATVHGKLFHHTYQSEEEKFAATIMPLFHPQLLYINPGMKRTAWTDMQKAMKFLDSK